MFVCPIDQKVLGFCDCIITFFNSCKAFIFFTVVLFHIFFSFIDSPLKKLIFRLEAILNVGILRVNCILKSIFLSFGKAVKILLIDIVSPGWTFTNFIDLRVFHLPKSNYLPDLFQDRADSRYQFTYPSSTCQRHFFRENLKFMIILLQMKLYTRSVISNL